jgi:hypothetical protein
MNTERADALFVRERRRSRRPRSAIRSKRSEQLNTGSWAAEYGPSRHAARSASEDKQGGVLSAIRAGAERRRCLDSENVERSACVRVRGIQFRFSVIGLARAADGHHETASRGI